MLLPERVDTIFLVAMHPASQGQHEEVQRVGHGLRLHGSDTAVTHVVSGIHSPRPSSRTIRGDENTLAISVQENPGAQEAAYSERSTIQARPVMVNVGAGGGARNKLRPGIRNRLSRTSQQHRDSFVLRSTNMPKPRIIRLAESWSPDPEDTLGEDKLRLIEFLLERDVGWANPMPISAVLEQVTFAREYTRNAFQHRLLGPLRRDPRVFVGTSSAGIFLVTTPADVDATLGFYTRRVRAELRHARNLRALARRAKLMEGHATEIPTNKDRATIYLDESGNPDVTNIDPPVFVVSAVVIASRQDLSSLDQRFTNAFTAIRRPEDHELRTGGLSVAKHARVLRELSLLEYQWAAACFDKRLLTHTGLADPVTFYKYAFQFLIVDLLTIAWQVDLVIDEHSTAAFQTELEAHLRRQNSGLPIGRLGAVTFSDSSQSRLVQLADLVAGAVRRSVDGHTRPLREIEHQMINLQFWPAK